MIQVQPITLYPSMVETILGYCYANISYMWAARIAAEILGCDFRDSKKAIEDHMGWGE